MLYMAAVLGEPAPRERVLVETEVVPEFVEQRGPHLLPEAGRVVLRLVAQVLDIEMDDGGHRIAPVGRFAIGRAAEEPQQILAVLDELDLVRRGQRIDHDRELRHAGAQVERQRPEHLLRLVVGQGIPIYRSRSLLHGGGKV